MRSGAKVLVICTAAVLAIAASANADVIAYWHFNDVTAIGGTNDLLRINPLGTADAQAEYARDFGIGVAEITVWGTADPSEGNLTGTNGGTPNNNFGSFAGSSLNALNGAGGGGSLTIVGATGNNGHYFLIELDDAIGTCVLTYATRGTSTGFSTHTIDYSTDNGATWMNAAVITGRTSTTWSVQTIDFMDLFAGTYGHESNLIRITVSGASGDGGNNRFDNIQINGALLTPGRCCADGACSITIKPDCDAIGGSWTDFGTCAGSPCTTGSCCHHDGTCQVTLQADCTGTWSAGTTCTPNTCPQPTGSCCHTDGTCAVTLQADCTGTWTMDGPVRISATLPSCRTIPRMS